LKGVIAITNTGITPINISEEEATKATSSGDQVTEFRVGVIVNTTSNTFEAVLISDRRNRIEEIIGSIGQVIDIKCEEGQWKAITFVTTDSNSFHSRISKYEV